MSDIAERIAAAKKQVETLKGQVSKSRDSKMEGYGGISSGAVKCVDIGKNTNSEGTLLGQY